MAEVIGQTSHLLECFVWAGCKILVFATCFKIKKKIETCSSTLSLHITTSYD